MYNNWFNFTLTLYNCSGREGKILFYNVLFLQLIGVSYNNVFHKRSCQRCFTSLAFYMSHCGYYYYNTERNLSLNLKYILYSQETMQQYLDMYILSHSPIHVQIVCASFSFGYYQNYFYGPTIKSCYRYFVPQDVCIYGIGRRFHIKIWLYESLVFNVLYFEIKPQSSKNRTFYRLYQ